MPLQAGYFDRPALAVAPDLIGARLRIGPCTGIITETEAYGRDDPASHSFSGPRPRNAAMFGPAGCAYVYRSYGIHWCLNVVCQRGEAVLLRALDPIEGQSLMESRRGQTGPRIAAGPGRLAQAMGITGADDGRPFGQPDFQITTGQPLPLLVGPRIGISRATDWPWRFGAEGAASLSRPFPRD
ncbi:MAG: DNA-3-methyladenine glycosylase [Gemmobacter sp.]